MFAGTPEAWLLAQAFRILSLHKWPQIDPTHVSSCVGTMKLWRMQPSQSLQTVTLPKLSCGALRRTSCWRSGKRQCEI